jgi:phosphate transport system substrate-binding protein
LRVFLLLGLALSLIALVACGDDDDDNGGDSPTATTGTQPTATTADGLDYGDLSGSVVADGSSTVFPITQAMAEEFAAVSNVQVKVGLSGTGGGFEKFCRGESQISDASRPIKSSEVEACAGNGIDDTVELQVAIDALTVVVNPENDWAQCMTVEQLTNAFKAGGATKWSDLDPSWPDENIIYYYPGADSGTFDYFVEAIIDEEEGATHRADGTSSEDDNVLVTGVEGDKHAIGYFGFAYFQEAGQELNAVEVDGGEGCVPPTFENALDGSYQPLSRPLFIYTRESLLEERPEVLGFVNFYYEILDEIVTEVGYVTMPADLKQAQVDKISAYLP